MWFKSPETQEINYKFQKALDGELRKHTENARSFYTAYVLG